MTSTDAHRRASSQPAKGNRPTEPIDFSIVRAQAAPKREHRLIAWMRTLVIFAVLAVVLLGTSLVVAIYWQAGRDQSRPVDAIVVLGAAQFDGRPSPVLRARLETALEAWNKGLAQVIIVTGGNQPGDRFTEAEASQIFLVDNGVPIDAILLEQLSGSTEENFDGAAAIMEAEGLNSALIVSDGFHLFRAKYIADSHGIQAFGLPAIGSPIDRWSVNEFFYVLREAAAVVDFWWRHL
jgi:uncharacterized SAM-binding protein YcdF (DUF218 family)